MHLVTPLAAGIAGAENGTAEIYKRGTTTRANYTLQFENFVPAYTSDLALDSYGGAVAYVGELCDVVVKTQGGAVLREFVAGVQDNAVEVISQSFTGSSYDGAMSGPDQPTTLGSVLDRWLTKNGGADWQVALPGGAVGSISTALGSVYGLVFSVMGYGAVGDGIAFDTTAIDSAIAAARAAGGGIVYFPPGDYRTSGHPAANYGDVSLIGAGPSATTIVLDSATATKLLNLQQPTTSGRRQLVANMTLRAATAAAGAALIELEVLAFAGLFNLYLDGAHCQYCIHGNGGSVADVIASACVMSVGPGTSSAYTSGDTSALRHGIFRDCEFIVQPGFAGSVLSAVNLDVGGCFFDNWLATSGSFNCLTAPPVAGSPNPTPRWAIHNCYFRESQGAAVTALYFGTYGGATRIAESNNVFGNGVVAYGYTSAVVGRAAQVHLGSRELRTIVVVDNADAPLLPVDQYGLVILQSNSTNLAFKPAAMPPEGARGTVVFYHPAGAGFVVAGAGFMGSATLPTVSGGCYIWEYRMCTPNTNQKLITNGGRDCGPGA